jgi:hypothetical protein
MQEEERRDCPACRRKVCKGLVQEVNQACPERDRIEHEWKRTMHVLDKIPGDLWLMNVDSLERVIYLTADLSKVHDGASLRATGFRDGTFSSKEHGKLVGALVDYQVKGSTTCDVSFVCERPTPFGRFIAWINAKTSRCRSIVWKDGKCVEYEDSMCIADRKDLCGKRHLFTFSISCIYNAQR